MRKFFIILMGMLFTLLFTACKQFTADIDDYLSYWSAEAFVTGHSIASAHRPDGAGVQCVGSSADALITLTAHNPKNLTLSKPAGIVEFKKLSQQPVAGTDYELKQTGSGTLELTYKQAFLQKYEQGSVDLSPTITLKAQDSRVFKQTYTFSIKSNSPPPKPEVVFAKTNSFPYCYVLCLKFNSAEMTRTVTVGSVTVPTHKDIANITINNTSYALLYKDDNSDFKKPAETSFIGSGEVAQLTETVPSGAWVLYFKTDIGVESINAHTSYVITLRDKEGVISDSVTAELKEKFKVEFDAKGGSPVPSQYIENGGKVTKPSPEPAKTGFTFGGWYKDPDCSDGQEWDFDNHTVTSAITLYAKWEPSDGTQYWVEHYQQNINDDNYPDSPTETVPKTGTTDASIALADIEKDYPGFKFDHIDPASPKIGADGNTVVKVYYKRKMITVTFNLNGGNVDGNTGNVTRTGKYGATFTPPTPDKTGYVFSGWNPALPSPPTYPATDTTYRAQWGTNITFSVEYGQGGSLEGKYNGNTQTASGSTPKTFTVTHEASVTFTATPNEGWEIDRWSDNVAVDSSNNKKATLSTITEPKNVTVKFKKITYTVHFNGNGNDSSTTMSDQHFTYGEPQQLTANGFTKTGYTFAGWATRADGNVQYTNQHQVSNLTTVANDTVNLYAKWTANTYTVHFNGNGKDGGSMGSQSFTYDQSQQLTANEFTKTGYTFDGWATSADGTKQYSNRQSVSNLTIVANGTVNLYAKWTANTYAVTFKVDGGHGSLKGEYNGSDKTAAGGGQETFTVLHGRSVTFTAQPDRGYEVDGWSNNVTNISPDKRTATLSNITDTTNTTVTVTFKPGEFNLAGGPDAWKRLKEEAAKTAGAHTIIIDGEITATDDSGNNGEITLGRNLTIEGKDSSAVLNADSKTRIFNVQSGKTLTLKNIKLENAQVGSTSKGGGVYIDDGGTLIMQGSTTITNCKAGDGGGVYVKGTFKMEGSALVTNETNKNNEVYLESGKSITVTGELTHTPAAKIRLADYQENRVLAVGDRAKKENFKLAIDGSGNNWRYKKVDDKIKFVKAELKVTFVEIKCLRVDDGALDNGKSEYYWTMKVDGQMISERNDGGDNTWDATAGAHLTLNESFTRTFSSFPVNPISVDIDIYEDDGGSGGIVHSGDDYMGTTKAKLTYNYDNDAWTWVYADGNWDKHGNKLKNTNITIGNNDEKTFTEQYRYKDGDTDVTISISWKDE